MYRRDRKKGRGGVMAYLSPRIPSRRVFLPKKFFIDPRQSLGSTTLLQLVSIDLLNQMVNRITSD